MDLATIPIPETLEGFLDDEQWVEYLNRLIDDPEFAARFVRIADGLSAGDLWGAPLTPPEEWFDPIEDLPGGTKITVTASGEVYGYFAEWGQCVIRGGGPGDCWTPPKSPSNYEPFHQSDVVVATADGGTRTINAGMIGIGGHAPQNASFTQAIRHYQFPDRGRMIAVAYENEIGVYVHGALLPSATAGDVALIRASALSGHYWEWRDRIMTVAGDVTSGWDCLGPCMVTRPGLPLTRETQFLGSNDKVAAAAGRGLPRRITSAIGIGTKPRTDAGAEDATRTITISGSTDAVDAITSLVASVQWAGEAGTSRTFSISIDGDGIDRIESDLPDDVLAAVYDALEGNEDDTIVVATAKEKPVDQPRTIEGPDGTLTEQSDGSWLVDTPPPSCGCGVEKANAGSCSCGKPDEKKSTAAADDMSGDSDSASRLDALEARIDKMETEISELSSARAAAMFEELKRAQVAAVDTDTELRDAIGKAAAESLGHGRVWVHSLLLSSDEVVLSTYKSDEGEGEDGLFRVGYSLDGDKAAISGELVAVREETSFAPI